MDSKSFPSPYIVGPPVRNPQDFFGRRRQIDQIFNMLRSPNLLPMRVLGLRRSGKTSFLRHISNAKVIADELGEHANTTFLAYTSLLGDVKTPMEFYKAVARSILRTFGHDERAAPIFGSFSEFSDWLEEVVKEKTRLVVLLDEFEVLASAEFDTYFFGALRSLPCDNLQSRFTWVTASNRDLYTLSQKQRSVAEASEFFNIFHTTPIILGGMETSEIEHLIRIPAKEHNLDFSDIEVKTIENVAGPLPYFLQAVAEQWFFARKANIPAEQRNESVLRHFIESGNQVQKQLEYYWEQLSQGEQKYMLQVARGQSTRRAAQSEAYELLSRGLLSRNETGVSIAGDLLKLWIIQNASDFDKGDVDRATTRPRVFISYSHRDEEQKERLLSHLGVLQNAGLVDLWCDDQISAGEGWEAMIAQAIAQAKIAVLLITANSLNSQFILRKEIPVLLQRHESEGLIVLPVIAKACPWRSVGWLARMNVKPKNGRPVWGDAGTHIDEDLAAIAEEIVSSLKSNEANWNTEDAQPRFL